MQERDRSVSRFWQHATLRWTPWSITWLVVFLLLRLPWLQTLVERDEGIFGYVGYVLATGGAPYRDVIDHHGLGLYAMYGAAYSCWGPNIIVMRVLVLGLQLFEIPLLFWIARTWFSKEVANWTIFFFVMFSSIPIFESHYALSESLATPFAVFGVYFYARWRESKNVTHYGLAWFFVAIASTIRFTLAFSGIILVVLFVIDVISKHRAWVSRIRILLWYGLWAFFLVSLVWAAVLMVLKAIGSLEAFVVIIPETFRYGTELPYVHSAMRSLIGKEGLPLFAFLLIGLLSMLLQIRSWNREHFYILLWAAMFVMVVTRPPMLGHYFIQLIPAASIIGAIGMVHFVTSLRTLCRSRYMRYASQLVLLTTVFGISFIHAIKHYPDMQVGLDIERHIFAYSDSRSYQDQLELANIVRDLLPDEEGLLIYGMEPAIYWLAEKRAPVRDTYTLNSYSFQVHSHSDNPFALVRGPNIKVVVMYDLYMNPTLDGVEYYVSTYYDYYTRIGEASVYIRN